MATSKTLAPTNVTISIPAMTDAPDASVFSNCVDKEADAINALNSKIAPMTNAYRVNWGTSLTWTFLTSLSFLIINATMMIVVWTASTSDLAILVTSSSGTYRKQGVNGVVNFGTTSTDESYTLTRSGTTVTLTTSSSISAKVFT